GRPACREPRRRGPAPLRPRAERGAADHRWWPGGCRDRWTWLAVARLVHARAKAARIGAMMNSIGACGAALLVAAALSSRIGAQPRSAVQARDIVVLGFKMHYLEAGSGPAVVLLHGLGGAGSRWTPNVEPLAKDFHVFALDQIGFGQSDKPLANYNTGMLAEFLVEFLKAVNI